MKKDYVSPLFEEVVLMTEDVLSDISLADNQFSETFEDVYDEEGDF